MLGKRFDHIVANSESVAQELVALRIRTRLSSIHNGIATQRFRAAGEQLDLDRLSGLPAVRESVVRVALAGTFARWKGHSIFFQALGLLPPELNIRAYVIGDALYQTGRSQYTMSELKAQARELCPAVQVGFTGFLPRMEQAYRALDLVVHASTEAEPFGMVLIEAMACGKPVLATRGGGVQEIVVDGVNGLLYKPADAAELASLMQRLVLQPDLRDRLGKAGLLTVSSRFESTRTAEAFARLYEDLPPRHGSLRAAGRA